MKKSPITVANIEAPEDVIDPHAVPTTDLSGHGPDDHLPLVALGPGSSELVAHAKELHGSGWRFRWHEACEFAEAVARRGPASSVVIVTVAMRADCRVLPAEPDTGMPRRAELMAVRLNRDWEAGIFKRFLAGLRRDGAGPDAAQRAVAALARALNDVGVDMHDSEIAQIEQSALATHERPEE